MKAAQVFGDRIIINEVPDVLLSGRKGAIVEVLGCGLCGSDIVKFDHKTVPQGTVLGHEIVAKILEINSDTNFKAGDVIVTTHHIPCGKCIYCKSGHVSMCRHFKETNLVPGGFSEKVFFSLKNICKMSPTLSRKTLQTWKLHSTNRFPAAFVLSGAQNCLLKALFWFSV